MAGQIRQYGRSLGQVSTGRTLTCMNIISKLGHCVSQLKDKISSHTEHGSEAEDGGDGGGGGGGVQYVSECLSLVVRYLCSKK